jgi:putative membrane protein insertion efficiency factor
MVKILSWFILTYKKLLSPLLGQHCRFYPSCSTYCLQAINSHGALKGSWLGLKRICRCHPMSAGGVDMVPTNCYSTTTLSDNKDHVANGY